MPSDDFSDYTYTCDCEDQEAYYGENYDEGDVYYPGYGEATDTATDTSTTDYCPAYGTCTCEGDTTGSGGTNWGNLLGGLVTQAAGAYLSDQGSKNQGTQSESTTTKTYPKWAEDLRSQAVNELGTYQQQIAQGPVPTSDQEKYMDQLIWQAMQNGGYFSEDEKAAQDMLMQLGLQGYENYFPEEDFEAMLGTMAPIKQQSQEDYMRQMALLFPQLGKSGEQIRAAGTAYNDLLAKIAAMEQNIYGQRATARQKAMLTTPEIQQSSLAAAQMYGITPQTAGTWYSWASVPRTREQQQVDWQLSQERILEEMKRSWAQLGYGAPTSTSNVTEAGKMDTNWYDSLMSSVGQALAGAGYSYFG